MLDRRDRSGTFLTAPFKVVALIGFIDTDRSRRMSSAKSIASCKATLNVMHLQGCREEVEPNNECVEVVVFWFMLFLTLLHSEAP